MWNKCGVYFLDILQDIDDNITDDDVNDLETMGLYFEALCERNLDIYAKCIGAKLYHYRENDTGVKVDVIVEIADGEYGAFEIKLGSNKEEEAAASLKRFYDFAEVNLFAEKGKKISDFVDENYEVLYKFA